MVHVPLAPRRPIESESRQSQFSILDLGSRRDALRITSVVGVVWGEEAGGCEDKPRVVAPQRAAQGDQPAPRRIRTDHMPVDETPVRGVCAWPVGALSELQGGC